MIVQTGTWLSLFAFNPSNPVECAASNPLHRGVQGGPSNSYQLASGMVLSGMCCSHAFEEVRDADAQGVGQHLDGVDGRVCASCLDARHVRPSEAATISERFLTHTHGHAQLPDSGAELVLKRWGRWRCRHSPMLGGCALIVNTLIVT